MWSEVLSIKTVWQQRQFFWSFGKVQTNIAGKVK